MSDIKKKALKDLSDKNKHEVYQKLLKERKEQLSPEAYKEYRKNIISEMGDKKENPEELDEVQQQGLDLRKRIAKRRLKNRK